MPPTLTAPASSASSRIRSTCSGASLMPGISGAIRIPVGIPCRLSSATASSRLRGCGVCGSVARHGLLVERGDRQVGADPRDTAFIASTSRSSSGDLVSTDAGVPESASARQISGISRYRPSTHWYGSVLVPRATCSRFHDGRASSPRSTSGALTLTTISFSKSRPASRPR